jgi:uncharacterized SAM-binding protein YcdF (DUF218 family)
MPSDAPRLLLRHWLWIAIGLVALCHYLVLAALGDPFNFGTLLSLGLFGVGVLVVGTRRLGRPFPPIRRRFRRLFWIGIGALGAWYLAMTSWMFLEARADDESSVDVVLVLGAGLKNGHATPALKRRIDRAAGYLAAHPGVPAVLCGGVGRGQPASEAAVMRDALVARGVSPGRLALEQRSTSTAQNVHFARVLVKDRVEREPPRALIITSNFHLARAKMLARNQGFEAYGLPASTPWYILPNTTARESVAIIKSVLVDLD